jgi:hypothetical protein
MAMVVMTQASPARRLDGDADLSAERRRAEAKLRA